MASSSNDRSSAPGCFSKALDLLSRRPHFRRELEQKLLRRDFASDEVEEALDRATERGFLDDLECAREFARVRVERRHEGPAKLLATLTRRGSDSDMARQVVAEHFADGESKQLKTAASRWLDRNPWHRERLARHLKGKGFSGGAILSALESLRTQAEVGGEAQ